MRTRRSWRNQNRLWEYLGYLGDEPAKPRKLSVEERIANLRTFIADPFTSKRARANAEREIERIKRAALLKVGAK